MFRRLSFFLSFGSVLIVVFRLAFADVQRNGDRVQEGFREEPGGRAVQDVGGEWRDKLKASEL